MSRQKNSNVISLLAFRKKKQKESAGKKRRAGDNRDDFFVDQGPKAAPKDNKPAQIYKMRDYLNKKNLPALEGEEKTFPPTGETEPRENIINLKDYNRGLNKKSPGQSKSRDIDNIVPFPDKKKAPKPKKSWTEEAMSFTAMTAMALMMMFAFGVLLSKESPDRKLASPQAPQRDRDKKPENQPMFFGKKPKSSDYTGF